MALRLKKHVCNDGSVFGKLFFNKTKAIYDKEGKCHEEEAEKDTILTDTKVTFLFLWMPCFDYCS